MTILSYHKFVEQESDYRFSRTYEQFWHDFRKKKYDEIQIDDGMRCMIKACQMLTEYKIRAKLFICTGLIGTEGYCTYQELRELSLDHSIQNHSSLHIDHRNESYEFQKILIGTAQDKLIYEIAKRPTHFVPPYNWYNEDTYKVLAELKLIPVVNRVNVLNISK